MIHLLCLGLLALSLQDAGGAEAPARRSAQHSTQDPEDSPEGRERYLGRSIARTMHWTGAPWLLRETREDEENGAALREWLAVAPGAAVCDLGCGNGYHTLPLARAVGQEGRVYAVDLQPEMLMLLRDRAQDEGLDHLEYVEATVDDPRLPEASCDLVLLVDVYHELSHPVRVLDHIRRALRPGGEVVLVEFRSEDRAVPIKLRHKMSKAQVLRELAAGGFELARETDDLPWQHVMAFRVAAPEPRHEPRVLARGFADALSRLDPRVVEPFLAGSVEVQAAADGAGARSSSARDVAVALAGAMRGTGAPFPEAARVELAAGPGDAIRARFSPPPGADLAPLRDECLLERDREGAWSVSAWRPAAPYRRPHGSRRPFVAMHTGTGPGAPADQARLTVELGFDGIAWGSDRLDQVRLAAEAAGGDLWSAYHVLDIADLEGSGLEQVRAAMGALAGGPGMVWLGLRSSFPRDHPWPDGRGERGVAMALLTELAAESNRTGVEVALYPHAGFWMETVEDALSLAEEAESERVGVCFNLCHYLKNHEGHDPAAVLRRAGDRLLAVTVNGADVEGEGWKDLIQPLGSGDHDLGGLLRVLDEVGFEGPVGLQAYGIRRPAREHLAASMAAWRGAHGR